jgi:hypothetical protein
LSYDIVRKAILDRRSLTARYDGAVLHFSPHVLGRHADRSFRVVAFQYAARGAAALPRGGRWRCLRLARLTRAAPNRDGWHSGHDLRRPLSCVVQIDVTSW